MLKGNNHGKPPPLVEDDMETHARPYTRAKPHACPFTGPNACACTCAHAAACQRLSNVDRDETLYAWGAGVSLRSVLRSIANFRNGFQ